jgi:DNA-binding response OmpR family regulator
MERPPSPTPEEREADEALRDARSRFVAGFTQRHGAMARLLQSLGSANADAALTALREGAHKMAGLAGVLGFPTVSEQSSLLEVALQQSPPDIAAANASHARMAAGFTHDLGGAAPAWAADAAQATAGARILLVEDDVDQRRLAASGLRAAGYRVITAESGLEAVATAQAERPDLIVLDVDLPDLDGMAVCRQLKLNPALSSVPIVFCTARTGVMDRMAGLTLGADDYVTKPFAPGELLMRIRRLLTQKDAESSAATTNVSGLLPFDLFATAANDLLSKGDAAVAMIRVARSDLEAVASRLADELRRRDLIGKFSDTHLVFIAPDMTAAAAKWAAQHGIEHVKPRLGPVDIGAADTAGKPDTKRRIDLLLGEADLALAQDRVAKSGGAAAGKLTVLLAEDDPDVLHIIDTRLRAAGYRTVMSLDGQQTLAAVEKESPAVLLLDLMMPKLTGFDVLMRLRERRGDKPKTIVVSARGRDDDVTRAFELGADDYVTKPFNPDELVARIARLTR